MNVQLVLLRHKGALIDLPAIQTQSDVPAGMLMEGHLDMGSNDHVPGKPVYLRRYNSGSGRVVLAYMYKPELADVSYAHFKVRGVEPVAIDGKTGMVVQEWLVFPTRQD